MWVCKMENYVGLPCCHIVIRLYNRAVGMNDSGRDKMKFNIFSMFWWPGATQDITNYINGMPTEVLGIVNAIGLGEAIGMIMAAGTARLLMQLIPFVRLGS